MAFIDKDGKKFDNLREFNADNPFGFDLDEERRNRIYDALGDKSVTSAVNTFNMPSDAYTNITSSPTPVYNAEDPYGRPETKIIILKTFSQLREEGYGDESTLTVVVEGVPIPTFMYAHIGSDCSVSADEVLMPGNGMVAYRFFDSIGKVWYVPKCVEREPIEFVPPEWDID